MLKGEFYCGYLKWEDYWIELDQAKGTVTIGRGLTLGNKALLTFNHKIAAEMSDVKYFAVRAHYQAMNTKWMF